MNHNKCYTFEVKRIRKSEPEIFSSLTLEKQIHFWNCIETS